MITKITNAWILTMNENMDEFKYGDILYEDDKIIYVGEANSSIEYNHIIDAQKGIVIPGMINTHCHVSMIPFRSLGDDCPDRLRRFLFPLELECMNEKLVYLSAKYGIVEMLLSGITTFVDMYYFMDEVAKACKETGIRALLGETIINQETCDSKEIYGGLKLGEEFIQRWRNDPLITPILAPHATNTNETYIFQKAMEICQKYDTLMTTHASEMDYEMTYFKDTYQMTPIEWLDSIGCLNDRCLLAHCIHITEEDIQLMKDKNVAVAHCIGSNMKAGKGIAPLKSLCENNVATGLGTDGPSSSNTLDLFSLLRLVAQSQKTKYHDRSLFQAKEIMKLATIQGAKAIHQNQKIGSIEVGKHADLTIISTKSIRMFPIYDPYSAIVYSANASDVQHVFVAGKHIVNDKKINIDVLELRNELDEAMSEFKHVAKIRSADL